MRLSLIAVGIILISANAYANTNLGQQLSICAANTDKTVRLTCYDELAANAKPSAHIMTTANTTKIAPSEAPRPPATPNVVLPLVATSPQVLSVDDFGLQKKVIEDEVDKIYSEVISVKKDALGAFVITLSNGQVWKQSSSKYYKIKKGQRIFIETGALNSFLLGNDDRNATTRVRRLK
jgi:mannose-6-phosphate isomerase class I